MDLTTLQTVYYSMGIVFMTLVFLAIITLVILAIYMYLKVGKIQRQIEEVVSEFKANPSEKTAEVILNVGAGIANAGAKKVREMMDKKKK